MSVPALQQEFSKSPSPMSDRRIRVAYLINSMRDGGAERQLRELFQLHDRERFKISLILMDGEHADRARPLVDDVFAMDIPYSGNSNWLPRSLKYVKAIRRTSEYLRRWRPDIVHAQLPGPCILGGIATYVTPVPVFIRSPRCLLSHYRSRTRVGAWLDDVFLRRSDFTIGNSKAVSRELLEVAKCEPAKCDTIYNGVDTQRFRPGLPAPWRKAAGWTGDEVVFGIVGNFSAAKRHCDFVSAAAILAQRYPKVRFVMMGADYGMRDALEQQIRKAGLVPKFIILDADPSPEQVFAGIDIYVCTSESEGFSNVVLEAMACGKPVIATEVGGNPEAVDMGRTGLLVPPCDPAALAKAAETLVEDGELRREMGRRGRERVEREFSLQRLVAQHEELYSRLVSAKRGRG